MLFLFCKLELLHTCIYFFWGHFTPLSEKMTDECENQPHLSPAASFKGTETYRNAAAEAAAPQATGM